MNFSLHCNPVLGYRSASLGIFSVSVNSKLLPSHSMSFCHSPIIYLDIHPVVLLNHSSEDSLMIFEQLVLEKLRGNVKH